MRSHNYFYLILMYVSLFSVVIPFTTGIIRRKYLDSVSNLFFYLVITYLILEIVSFSLANYHVNNLFVARINTVLQFILLSVFFSRAFHSTKISLFIKIFIFFFLGTACIDLYLNGLKIMDNLSLTTSCILLMIYSLLTFFYLIQKPLYSNILSTPLFWFNTAVLVYFSGNLFLFLFTNYLLKKSLPLHFNLWTIHSILNIIFNSLISIGFWKTENQPK